MEFAEMMSDWLVKIKKKESVNQIRNLDCIYLINLDKRPERLARSLEQLTKYEIFFDRIPAIDGWKITQETFNEIAFKVTSTTVFDLPVHFSPVAGGTRGWYLNSSSIGKSCVHYTTAAGALGCYLSHLSALQDAYSSGYQMIWILEDDFTLLENPRVFSDLIDKLNDLSGSDGWDILYTDNDDHFIASTINAHMGGGIWGRPGIPLSSALLEYQALGSDFLKIGGRTQTHSMIVHRSGMKKMLDFITKTGIFRPYDLDLAFVPGLRMFNLVKEVVHGRDRTASDTFYKLK